MIAFWVIVFTIVNLIHSIELLLDCSTHLRPPTVAVHGVGKILMCCVGWARIWSLLYAMPPSENHLVLLNQKIGSRFTSLRMNHCIPASLFNIFIIFAHVITLLVPIPFVVNSIKEYAYMLSTFEQYKLAYAKIMDPSEIAPVKSQNELEALTSIKNMEESSRKFQWSLRQLSVFFLILSILQLSILMWTSLRIIRALYNQVIVLQHALERRKALELNLEVTDSKCDHPPGKGSAQRYELASAKRERRESVDFASDVTALRLSWKRYLPIFRRGTGISPAVWNSGPFKQDQKEIMSSRVEELKGYYHQLKRYAINIVWQTVMAGGIIISCTVLSALMVTDAFSFSAPMEYEMTVFTWTNITWNGGPGLILGIISCIVTFSALPTPPREPDTRTIDADSEC